MEDNGADPEERRRRMADPKPGALFEPDDSRAQGENQYGHTTPASRAVDGARRGREEQKDESGSESKD